MRILVVSSELAPFAKTSGVADSCSALARALADRGHEVRLVVPRYRRVARGRLTACAEPLGVPTGVGERWCLALQGELPASRAQVYFLEHDQLFDRPGLYGPPGGAAFPDNCLRFTVLCRGALQLCRQLGWRPDVIHCHDWQAALVPAFVRAFEERGPLAGVPTVLTIHNLTPQGRFDPRELAVTGLGWEYLDWQLFENNGEINVLKGGIALATIVTTVSPSYALEIQQAGQGEGLEGLLRFRGARLRGVLDGIDEAQWDPANDPFLPARYDAVELGGKAACKAELQRCAGLEERPDLAVAGFIGRLDRQRGADLLREAAERLTGLGVQLVVLGTATPEQEQELWALSARLPGVRLWLEFNEPLTHLIQGGADLLLVPSLHEPAGVTQLIAQRYGTLPVVTDVGGLRDSVVGQGEPGATGFKLPEPSADALVDTVRRALELRASRPGRFLEMIRNAMARRSGWDQTAARYEELYREACSLAAPA